MSNTKQHKRKEQKQEPVGWEEELRIRLWYLDLPKKYHRGLLDFVHQLLRAERQSILKQVKGIIKQNHDKISGTYDYDGIAEDIINFLREKG